MVDCCCKRLMRAFHVATKPKWKPVTSPVAVVMDLKSSFLPERLTAKRRYQTCCAVVVLDDNPDNIAKGMSLIDSWRAAAMPVIVVFRGTGRIEDMIIALTAPQDARHADDIDRFIHVVDRVFGTLK